MDDGLSQQGWRVVVPSPATSLVLVETSFTSWAPMFSKGSLQLDLLGDGDAVVGDQGSAELLYPAPRCGPWGPW